MGQIITTTAKPKRCNLQAIQSGGSLASTVLSAGETMLVCSDNSMSALGVGNFDCYVVGDGTTACSALDVLPMADVEPIPGSMNSVTSEGINKSIFDSTEKGNAAFSMGTGCFVSLNRWIPKALKTSDLSVGGTVTDANYSGSGFHLIIDVSKYTTNGSYIKQFKITCEGSSSYHCFTLLDNAFEVLYISSLTKATAYTNDFSSFPTLKYVVVNNLITREPNPDVQILVESTNIVKSTSQTLTDADKKQVRINIGLGNGDIDNTPTEDSLNVVTSGGVFEKLSEIEEYTDNLNVYDYSPIEVTSIQEGKVRRTSDILENSKFDIYTYEVDNSKIYGIRGRMPRGYAYYLVYFSSDAGCTENVSHLNYRGSYTDYVLYVPPKDADYLYEKIEIPSGANYMHINVRNNERTINYTSVVEFTIREKFNASKNDERISVLESNARVGNSIEAIYQNPEHLEKVRAIYKRVCDGRGNEDTHIDNSQPQPLVLLHFSDAHGNDENVGRVIDYYNIYKNYINDVIHTGDLVADYYAGGFDNIADIEGFEKVLQVIGNHDTRIKYSEDAGYPTNPWNEYAGETAYETYIEPFVDNWGDIVFPTDEVGGETVRRKCCYYYKDYISSNIRLIVLDNMVMNGNPDTTSTQSDQNPHYDANQLTWFTEVLNAAHDTANNKDMTVVVAMHFSNVIEVIDCSFTSYDSSGNVTWGYPEMRKFFQAVDTFKQSGGKFACYICGHTHQSLLAYTHDYDDQLIICVGSTICAAAGSWPRAMGTKTQDFMHLLGVDDSRGIVKVQQIGVEWDARMRHRDCLCYDYFNNEIIKISE